jgi:hypothetical protein
LSVVTNLMQDEQMLWVKVYATAYAELGLSEFEKVLKVLDFGGFLKECVERRDSTGVSGFWRPVGEREQKRKSKRVLPLMRRSRHSASGVEEDHREGAWRARFVRPTAAGSRAA